VTVISDKTETINENLKAMVSATSQQIETKLQTTPQQQTKIEPTFTQEKKPKKNRTWLYIGAGAIVAGGSAYYFLAQSEKAENTGTLLIMVPQNP
jgi:hypothetical protein